MIDLQILQAELDSYQFNDRLMLETNVALRAEAMALIVLVERVASAQRHRPEALLLRRQADHLRQRIIAVDQRLFQHVRRGIQTGRLTAQALRSQFDQVTTYRKNRPHQAHMGYDGLDALLRGVLEVATPPQEREPGGEGMVHFERTPARAVLELVDRTQLAPESVFYDLGAGLGHVAILVHLLTGATCIGVEIEPAYCAYARRCIQELGIEKVTFLQEDAQYADYTAGQVFFMFTPFTGSMWRTVLERLAEVVRRKPIQVCSYGPCTQWLAQCSWLVPCDENFNHEFKLAIFRSMS
jgi:SAM-dependent methyltransferase